MKRHPIGKGSLVERNVFIAYKLALGYACAYVVCEYAVHKSISCDGKHLLYFRPIGNAITADSLEEVMIKTIALCPGMKVLCVDCVEDDGCVADFICPTYRELLADNVNMYELEV